MVAVTAAWNKPLPSRILLFALFFCYERKIGGHGLMASGKVRCPAALDFPETDGSVPVNASYMPVECPFGSDMDVKTVPSGDFKEHSSRDPFPVQEFLFLFIEQQLMLLFPRSALFRLFLLLFPAFLFLPPFVCLTGLHQGGGVKSESLEHADGDQPDKGSSFRALKRIRDPVPAIGGGFLPAAFSFEEPA